jgi:formylglycine-generating enzyme required for sulfatase activity
MRYVAGFGIGFGSVGYNYSIGKYEVTNAQYNEFLNAVDPAGANTLALYGSAMTSDARGGILFNSGASDGSKYATKSGRDNNPVVFVTWYSAIRFANWLHNGQGGPGTTEDGAYTLLESTPTPSNGSSITRNPGALWFLPTEDEWYKAAYHKNNGVTGNYWTYPFSSDNITYSATPPGSSAPDQSKTANYYKSDGVTNGYNDGYAVTGSTSLVSSQNYLADVGAYSLSVGPYGTHDQGGNVLEWNETIFTSEDHPPFRGIRGGSWRGLSDRVGFPNSSEFLLRSSTRGSALTTYNMFDDLGFRVATMIIIPEPTTVHLIVISGMLLSCALMSARGR